MIKRKNVKLRGKIQFTQYFQEFSDGDRVAVIREHTFSPAFPVRIQGKSGVIIGKRGDAYIVKINDGKMEKTYIIKPVHLKKLA